MASTAGNIAPSSSAHHPHRHAPHEVRIIGGSLKRSKLAVLDATGLRPTPNRVRETLFNWLGSTLQGWRCLDMFAGTGALGLEAASRGAEHVLLVERNAECAALLKANVQRLQANACEVRQADGLQAAQGLPRESVDLVFVDPPFDAGLHAKAAQAALPVLKAGGLLYIEAADEAALQQAGYSVHKQARAGAVSFGLLMKNESIMNDDDDKVKAS